MRHKWTKVSNGSYTHACCKCGSIRKDVWNGQYFEFEYVSKETGEVTRRAPLCLSQLYLFNTNT